VIEDAIRRCQPARQIHEFNNRTICQCGRMRDDGTAIEIPQALPMTRPEVATVSGTASISLEQAAALVAQLYAQKLRPSLLELELVHNALQATLRTIRRPG
jgi:hypothetical protein